MKAGDPNRVQALKDSMKDPTGIEQPLSGFPLKVLIELAERMDSVTEEEIDIASEKDESETAAKEAMVALLQGKEGSKEAMVALQQEKRLIKKAMKESANRYKRTYSRKQADVGLRAALKTLAFASLMHPRLAADAPTGTGDLPADVVGVVGDEVPAAMLRRGAARSAGN